MSDDTPGWFDDELDPPPGRRRRQLVAAAVTVPWLVIAVVLVRGDGPTGTTPPDTAPLAEASAPDPDPAPAPDTAPDDTSAVAPGEDPPPVSEGSTTGATAGEATAVAVAVARAWLSDAGPDLEVPGIEPDRRAYLEHAVVRELELAADDAAVATVSVVLLTRDDEDRYDQVLVGRVAVPLTLTATTVHPAGPPWWLGDDELPEPRAPELAPVDDPALVEAVTSAIAAAGYEDVTVTGVSRGGGDLIVASATGRLADGTELPRAVWLRDTTDGAVLLGSDAPSDREAEATP